MYTTTAHLARRSPSWTSYLQLLGDNGACVVIVALSGRLHNYSDVIWSHTSIRLREMVPLTKGAACHEPARTASPWPKPSGQNSKPARVDIRHRIRKLCGPGSCSTRPKAWATTRSPHAAASRLQM